MRTTDYPKSVPISGRVRICLEMVRHQNIKGIRVIDVGSTFGWLEKTLEKDGAKEIVGVELSEPAVAFAKKLAPQAKFFVGSALDLQVKDGVADIAFLFDVIEHVPVNTEPKALSELNRVLKKGGILLLSTPHSHPLANLIDIAWYLGHRHYSPEQITQLLKDAGFKVKKLEVKGSIWSSLYLLWFYIAKRVLQTSQPRNAWLEKMDDQGYNTSHLTDIFLVAEKV